MSSSMTGFYLFMSLPEEMSMHIISFLSAEDMCALARTSRDLKRFSVENMLWRKLCKRKAQTTCKRGSTQSLALSYSIISVDG